MKLAGAGQPSIFSISDGLVAGAFEATTSIACETFRTARCRKHSRGVLPRFRQVICADDPTGALPGALKRSAASDCRGHVAEIQHDMGERPFGPVIRQVRIGGLVRRAQGCPRSSCKGSGAAKLN